MPYYLYILGSDAACEEIWWDSSIFQDFKSDPDYFDPDRQPIFHYMIWADLMAPACPTVVGISRNSADPYHSLGAVDFVVALGGHGGGAPDLKKGIFLHELGHNLGLKHGGEDHENFKPNYLSIMNYSFMADGLLKADGTKVFEYSKWTIPPLNENALSEPVGLNGGEHIAGYGTSWWTGEGSDAVRHDTLNANGPIDWNWDDDTTDQGLVSNINQSTQEPKTTTLTTQDDWSIITFSGNGVIGNPGLKDLSAAELEKLFPRYSGHPCEWPRSHARGLEESRLVQRAVGRSRR